VKNNAMTELAQLEDKLLEVKNKLDEATNGLQEKLHNTTDVAYRGIIQAMLHVERSLEVTQQKIANFKESGRESYADLKAGLDLALEELKEAVRSANQRF
jgi:molecular chaperone GrpE (heat shock protein)